MLLWGRERLFLADRTNEAESACLVRWKFDPENEFRMTGTHCWLVCRPSRASGWHL